MTQAGWAHHLNYVCTHLDYPNTNSNYHRYHRRHDPYYLDRNEPFRYNKNYKIICFHLCCWQWRLFWRATWCDYYFAIGYNPLISREVECLVAILSTFVLWLWASDYPLSFPLPVPVHRPKIFHIGFTAEPFAQTVMAPRPTSESSEVVTMRKGGTVVRTLSAARRVN